MGSVKDLKVNEEPTKSEFGRGKFVFSDRYSVFDWGEMPDLIPEKGEVLAMMGGYNFELLERNGIKTHYRGMVENGKPVSIEELNSPSSEIAIRLAHKPEVEDLGGTYHYEDLSSWSNFLIPLEIVFRNYVPVGSSIRRRYDPSEVGLDYEEWPDTEVQLEEPMVEFSTKLERQDRYLDREEAFAISGLSEEEFGRLEELGLSVNRLLTDHARTVGFKHLDGKIECIYDRGEILLADVAGTFDENRFSSEGQQISKEVLRQWYKKRDKGWYERVSAAKKEARGGDLNEWKKLVEESPRNLDPKLKQQVADLYRAGANRWLEDDLFKAPDLSEVLEDLKKWKKEMNL